MAKSIMLGLFCRLVDIIVVIKALYMLKCIRLPHFAHFAHFAHSRSPFFVFLFHYRTVYLSSWTHWPAVSLKETDMLSVSDILTISIAKNLLNLDALLALDPRDLSGGIVD